MHTIGSRLSVVLICFTLGATVIASDDTSMLTPAGRALNLFTREWHLHRTEPDTPSTNATMSLSATSTFDEVRSGSFQGSLDGDSLSSLAVELSVGLRDNTVLLSLLDPADASSGTGGDAGSIDDDDEFGSDMKRRARMAVDLQLHPIRTTFTNLLYLEADGVCFKNGKRWGHATLTAPTQDTFQLVLVPDDSRAAVVTFVASGSAGVASKTTWQKWGPSAMMAAGFFGVKIITALLTKRGRR